MAGYGLLTATTMVRYVTPQELDRKIEGQAMGELGAIELRGAEDFVAGRSLSASSMGEGYARVPRLGRGGGDKHGLKIGRFEGWSSRERSGRGSKVRERGDSEPRNQGYRGCASRGSKRAGRGGPRPRDRGLESVHGPSIEVTELMGVGVAKAH